MPKVAACQKASHRGKLPKFAHFRQHKTTTTQRGKRPSGLFSTLGISRGIPVCPCELENTLALSSTDQRKNSRNSPSSGLDTNEAAGWRGRKGSFPVPWVSLQHAGLIKLKYLSRIACFHRLYQARHFPALCSCPSRKGAALLPAPVHACSNHINHKACFYLVKPLSSEVFRLVW